MCPPAHETRFACVVRHRAAFRPLVPLGRKLRHGRPHARADQPGRTDAEDLPGSATARGRSRRGPRRRLAGGGRADDGARGEAGGAHRRRRGRGAAHVRRRARPRPRQARGLASMPGAAVLGTGFALPEREVSNDELTASLDTSDAWIVSRTGIRTRRTLDGSGLAASDLAVAAARMALARARVDPAGLDLVIVATCSGDYPIASTACLVQAALEARRAAAFDVTAACSGFIYGLTLADQALATGAMSRVLLIGADALTRHVDWEDRATAILFGDGAGAVVLGPGGGLLGTHLGADGRRAGDIRIAAGGSRRPVDEAAIAARLHKIAMTGPEVFRAAVEAMADALAAASERAGVRPTDLRWVFAHQANARIVRSVAERLGVTLAAFRMNVERYGNTGAASIPIALAEADTAGHLVPGDLIGLTAAGAGLTWGAAILRWSRGAP